MKRKVTLLLGLIGSAVVSQAALIPILLSTDPGGLPGTTEYSYTVSLAADERIDTINPAELTVFGFDGYVDGTLTVGIGAPDWAGVALIAGPTHNLVFTYSGSAVNGPVNPVLSFSADSIYSDQKLSTFTATDSKNSPNPTEDGTPAFNGGAVAVPAAADTAVPEPATMALVGFSLLALGALRRGASNRR